MTQPWEIQDFLSSDNGQLHIDGANAVELAKEFGSPLFVFSEARIRHNIARLREVENVIDCPLKLCYAAKAVSNMAIIRAVGEAGSDLEVNSGGELWKALKAGFSGDRLIFNGTSKEIWELEMAINAEIYAIQVDSLYELSLISETAKALNKTANVSLRLVPDIETNTHSGLKTALLTSKFGMMPEEALEAFRKYKDSPELNLAGVHLHIGSQNPDISPYTEAFDLLFSNLLQVYKETGVKLSHINLGGGFPVNYLRDDSLGSEIPAAQHKMFAAHYEPAEAIREAWNSVKNMAAAANAEHLLEDFTLLLEPGRSVIADTSICLTTVRNKKQRPVPGAQPSTDIWLLTDAGFNLLLSMETYKWYYHLISAERADVPAETKYKVAGPLCDGGDVYFDIEGEERLPDYRLLPENVEPNELLALLNCGAYSFAQASEYNGRFLPAMVMIKMDGKPELIRKRDSFEDLIRNDV